MADEGTLATTAQVLLAIGENPSSAQALEANTNYWIKFAESEMEKEFNKYYNGSIGLVTNYASIDSSMKQWLAMVASHRAAFHAIQEHQNQWQLATTQSKLNVIDAVWQEFKRDLKDDAAEIITSLGI